MLKTLCAAAAVTFTLASPVFAASACDVDDATWSKTEAEFMAMEDGDAKTSAMADWKLATEARAAKNLNDCDSALTKAMETKDNAKKK